MSKLETDKLQTDVVKAIVLNPTTVNTYKEPVVLSPDELQKADNIIMDNDVIEKSPGTYKGNSDIYEGGTGNTGLHRAYGTGTEKQCLRITNGVLKTDIPDFGTTILSGLSTTKLTPFINARGRSYGVNQTDGIIRYDPKIGIGVKTGIVGPALKKKLCFFESDETWGNSGTQVSEYYRGDEWTGDTVRALYLSASASSNSYSTCLISLDMSQFENGKASTSEDLINLYTFHKIRGNIDYFTIEFSTGSNTFTTKKMVEISGNELEIGDFQWTKFEIKKSAFIDTGSPNWNDVQAVRITVYATSSGTAEMYFDSMSLRIVRPTTFETRKQIATFDQSETWVNVSGQSLSFDTKVFNQNFCSMKMSSDGTNYKTVSLDLTKWPNNSSSSVSDEIVIDLMTSGAHNIVELYIRFYYGAGAGDYYSMNYKSVITADNVWLPLRKKKSSFSSGTGSPSWETIVKIEIYLNVTTPGDHSVWFDNLRMEKYNADKYICGEPTDSGTWVFSPTTYVKWSTDIRGIQGESSGQCIQLIGNTSTFTQKTATFTPTAAFNLTQWTDGSASTTDDVISFYLWQGYPTSINFIEIFMNIDSNDFTNYLYYKLEKSGFVNKGTKNNVGGEIRIPKSEFTGYGTATSANWNNITKIRITVENKVDGGIFIDTLSMKRNSGFTGRYYYKYCYGFYDVKSAFSQTSNYIDVIGGFVSISNIMNSQDSRVKYKEVYRLGGTFPQTWKLCKVLDNTTESFTDDLDDEELGDMLTDDIPQGEIDSMPCENLVYDTQSDRVFYWGHEDFDNRLYVSNAAYFHVVNYNSFREFNEKVMGVIPFHGQYLILLRSGIKRIEDDILLGTLVDLPITSGANSVYGHTKVHEGLASYVGVDNVYLCDGYKSLPIGYEVQNYFKGQESLTTKACMVYHKDSIYVNPTESVALRYYIPKKSWTVRPDWNVKIWSKWDDKNDANDLYYLDSEIVGAIAKIDYPIYRFHSSPITSEFNTGWINNPETELRFHSVEFKAIGTGQISVYGYKNGSDISVGNGSVTISESWKTYTIKSPLWSRNMVGDTLKVKFVHSTDNAYFKMKDITIYAEKIPKRSVFTEIVIT